MIAQIFFHQESNLGRKFETKQLSQLFFFLSGTQLPTGCLICITWRLRRKLCTYSYMCFLLRTQGNVDFLRNQKITKELFYVLKLPVKGWKLREIWSRRLKMNLIFHCQKQQEEWEIISCLLQKLKKSDVRKNIEIIRIAFLFNVIFRWP